MRTNAIVVGTDGTASSHAAVEWAAREAQRRGAPLHIVHAFDWEVREAVYDFGGEHLRRARECAEAVAATAVDRARAVAPDLTVTTQALPGHATPRLLEAASEAALLVVGSRGRGGFTGLLLGSVSRRVATHSPTPVVVVRHDRPATDRPTTAGVNGSPAADHPVVAGIGNSPAANRPVVAGIGNSPAANRPVVAGIDDSPAADLVLEAAFAAASARFCPLTVLHAYVPAFPLWLADVAPPTVDIPEQDAADLARLEARLAPWHAKFPDVPLQARTTHLSPAHALVEASRTARLLIIGTHGHGPLTGALLGSTGLQLLHHAACPVEVVPQHA